MAAYAVLAVSAVATVLLPREALFGIAAASLLLLFIGIHNAWDGGVVSRILQQAGSAALSG